ncbi:MAG TPA: hypothetical protein VHJ18_10640 [Streptosporangiaceae bacterium]|nr:hypothetical protein [Streptosporangiaceae bacterium]
MRRSRWLGTARHGRRRAAGLAAAMVPVAALLAGLSLAACGTRAGPAVAGATAAAADPELVAIAGHGSASRIELVSARTGRVAKVLAGGGTGNGFALSPDAKDVYVVGSAGHAVEVRRISVATGKVSFVAEGACPAVSPDGRYLAYATGSGFSKLAVRDLRSGHVRVADLRSLLGNGGNLLNQGQVTWLGDGNELIVVPGITASEAAATLTANTGAGTAGIDQVPPGRQSLIVVKLRPDGLAVRKILVPDPYQDPSLLVSGDLSQQRAVLIARMGYAEAGTITRVSLSGDGYKTSVVAKLPRGLMPITIAPHGDRVLYLVGHSLWVAAINGGSLTGKHRLIAGTSKFGFDQAAW